MTQSGRKEFVILCYTSAYCKQSWHAMTNVLYHERSAIIVMTTAAFMATVPVSSRVQQIHHSHEVKLFYPLQTASATRFHWRKWVLFDLLWVLWTFWNLNLRVGLARHRKDVQLSFSQAQELEIEGFSIVNVSYIFEKVTSLLWFKWDQCVIILYIYVYRCCHAETIWIIFLLIITIG